MIKKLNLFLLSIAAFLLIGCASPIIPKPIYTNDDVIDLKKHGVVVVSLDLKNTHKPDWSAYKLGASFIPTDIAKIPQSQLSASYFGGPYSRDYAERVKSGRTDIVSVLVIPEGEYVMNGITGSSFPGLIGSGIHFPVNSSKFTVKAGQGVYLGDVNIVVKTRSNESELKLDQLVGLSPWLGQTSFIGQGASEFSKSTPVITTGDRFNDSIKEIKVTFPSLKNITIVNTPINIELGTTKIVAK
jgi:hypothetical protein